MLRSSLILAVYGFSEDHPIHGVMSVIEEIKVTAKKDQETSNIQYEKDMHDCQTQIDDYKGKVAKQKTENDKENATMQAKINEANALTDQIAELEKRLEGNTGTKARLEDARSTQNQLYLDTTSTVQGTIAALKGAMAQMTGAPAALTAISQQRMKVMAQAYLPENEQHLVNAFLAKHEAGEDPPEFKAAPEARVYDSKLGTVKALFVKLIRKFEDKLSKREAEETRASNAHTLSLSALTSEATAMTDLKNEKNAALGEAETVKGDAQQALTQGEGELATLTKQLDDKTRECNESTSAHEKETKERREELTALDIAMDILKSISGVRAGHEELPATFLQLLGLTPKDKVVQLLRTAGGKLHSAQLEKLAMEIGASEGPFNQINNMIQKMVDRLIAEQRKEDDHKAWCDRELESTLDGQDRKNTTLLKVEADTDTATSNQATSEGEKVNAATAIADAQKYKAEETEKRRLQTNNNKISIDDAKKAQKGLQQAIVSLTEFKEQSQAKNDAIDRVLVKLKDAEEDYLEMETTIRGEDATQKLDYTADMQQKDIEIAAQKAKETTHKEKLLRLSNQLSTLGKKKKHAKDALFEYKQYLDDLKPACGSGREGNQAGYDERKAARDKEREALKDAKQILADAFKQTADDGTPTAGSLVSVKKHEHLATK